MTAAELDHARRAAHIELAPLVDGFAALWHVGDGVTAERAREWARSEGIPLRRVVH
jgi:hypothetical protein